MWMSTFGIAGFLCCTLVALLSAQQPDKTGAASRSDWTMVLPVGEDVYFDRSTGHYFRHKGFQFHIYQRFAEGLCVVERPEDEKKGYIDRSGRVVIPFQYDGAARFEDGCARVYVGEEPGIIDATGGWVIEPGRYKSLGWYSEGRCAFSTDGVHWGFLDRQGNVVIPPVFSAVRSMPVHFAEGLCLVKHHQEMVYINLSGKVAIRLPEKVTYAYPFSDGMARVEVHVGSSDDNPLEWDRGKPRTLSGYIDRTGHMAIPPRFGTAGDFCEGLAPVSMTEDGTYVVTRELIGRWNPDPDFPTPPPRWGFIDKNGTVTIPFVYERAGHFSEGLAAVKQDGRWGYMDRRGRMVIGAGFEDAREFRDGITEVVVGDKIVYIDRHGRLIARTDFSGVSF